MSGDEKSSETRHPAAVLAERAAPNITRALREWMEANPRKKPTLQYAVVWAGGSGGWEEVEPAEDDPTPDDVTAPDHYAPLREFLDAALERASKGKGHQRHANGKPFLEQPTLVDARLMNSPDGMVAQIRKKALELRGLEREAAMREALDIAVYAGAVWLWLREQD